MKGTRAVAYNYIFSEYRDQRKAEGSIRIKMDDKFTLVIPPPECWPDDTPKYDVEKIMRHVLGDDDVDKFIKRGGTMRMLNSIFEDAESMSSGKSEAS